MSTRSYKIVIISVRSHCKILQNFSETVRAKWFFCAFKLVGYRLLCKTSLISLPKKCPYSSLFWSIFSRIRTEYAEILPISPYSVRMKYNTNQNNPEYGQFLRSVFKSSLEWALSIILKERRSFQNILC